MTIAREFLPDADRYMFDFTDCHCKDGWAQCDTRQDASYFGTWANPLTLKIVQFAEGDVTREQAYSPEEFCSMVRRHAQWNYENEGFFRIDGMGRHNIIQAFKDLGLGDLLHAGQ